MPDGRLKLRVLVPAVLLALCAGALAETPNSHLYLRGVKTHSRALEIIDARADRRQSDALVIVFDAVSFSPPPLLNEFKIVQDYRGDIEAWLDALTAANAKAGASGTKTPGNVFVATTLSSSPRRLGAPGWREALRRDLERRWWEGQGLAKFAPATSWMARILQKVPGPRRTLCLITGELLPERLADATRDRTARLMPPERWRKKLLPVGSYWDEEAVGFCLKNRGTVLDVIAPEVRFGDFWPWQELPELPWASRPGVGVRPGTPKHLLPKRFHSATPLGQTLCGSYIFFNTDIPSGFGYWRFARAAAITNGGYIFYPFASSDFLDACPYDPILMKYVAPEPGSRQDILKSKAGDPALQALLDAAHLVMDKTPWRDGPPRATGWAEIASLSPVALESRYRERNKPIPSIMMARLTVGSAESRGRELAKVLPLYDQAIENLSSVHADIASGRIPAPHRRSRANLRLGIYWFEMSAFHLEALSLYLKEIRKNIPEEQLRTTTEFAVTFERAIRMSDCLRGYEGRSISRERDRELQVGWRNPICGPQGNLLPFLETDPDYRALRHPAEVLKNLDPRLMSRALRMIDAARDVMRNEGRSPWGWVVYYSEAVTFSWYGLPPTLRGSGRSGTDDPEGQTTPRPKTRPGGPSSGK